MADASGNPLIDFSSQLASVVATAGASVVRVDDGSRFTATGIVWSNDGIVVSTSHGVERDEELAIETGDGQRRTAALVGRDPDTDIAVLKTDPAGLTPIARANESGVRVGALALALGRPGAAGLQATIGVVSARLESVTDGRPGYLLHTDAVLYPGFSGGALIDVSGKITGLTNRAYGRGKGMAVGVPVVEAVVDAILANGKVQRGYLGIRTQAVVLPAVLRGLLGRDQEAALLIVQVEPNSPAEAAGLLLGDTLLAISEVVVEDAEELRHRLRKLPAGTVAAVDITRGGEMRRMTVTLGSAE